MKKIVALESDFAKAYYTKIENATIEQAQQAKALFEDKNKKSIYEVREKTAIIKITGILSKSGPSFIDLFFGYGGTAYPDIIDSINKAENDNAIENIVLEMDTPGGEAMGVDEVYQVLAAAKKKTTCINMGMIASAGYYIASAADEIRAIEPINLTGSIGVVITVIDWSENHKKWGVKIYDITSENAPNKIPDVSTKKGRDILKDRVDAIENVFIQRVAEGRKTTIENVKENFGRGALFIAENPSGQDAIKAGMIDGLIESENLKNPENNFFYSVSHNKPQKNPDNQDHIKAPHNGEKAEEFIMLKEFLAKNPEALNEYNNDISQAEKRGGEQLQAKINKVIPFIGNEKYQGIAELFKKVLSGESKIEALEGAVTVFDMQAQKNESTAAKQETEETEETPPNDDDSRLSEDGIIRNEADYQNSKKMAAKQFLGGV